MTNPFLFGDDQSRLSAQDDPRSLASSLSLGDPVGPPMPLLLIVAVELIVLGVLFIPASGALHWVGYLCGSVVVPTTVFLFRRIDRTRQASDYYGAPGWVKTIPSAMLMLGVGLAAAHAFYLAVSKHLS